MERIRDGSKVLEMIRDAILRLELRPGAVLDEAGLAEQLNVSRTPVREAIIQLIASGLAIRDGRTARVSPLDFDEVPKLHDALVVSSRMIHRLAAQYRTEQHLSRIKAAMLAFEEGIGQSTGLRRSELNLAFHMEIAEAAQNRYFAEFYEHVLIASIRLSRACFSGKHDEFSEAGPDDNIDAHMAETCRQHRLMYEAIEARDVESSDQLAIMHQDLARDRLQRLLFRKSSALTGVEL